LRAREKLLAQKKVRARALSFRFDFDTIRALSRGSSTKHRLESMCAGKVFEKSPFRGPI